MLSVATRARKRGFKSSMTFFETFGLYFDTQVRERNPDDVAERVAFMCIKHCGAHRHKRMCDLQASDFTGYPKYLSEEEALELFDVLKGFFEWCKCQDLITSGPANVNAPPKLKTGSKRKKSSSRPRRD